MSLISPYCHHDPLCSGVKIIWLIAVNSLFCYCQKTELLFCQKAGMCAKQDDLGLALSPLSVTPSPLLPFPSPFCALLGTAKQLFYWCDPGELRLKVYQFIPSVHIYSISYQPVSCDYGTLFACW